MKHLKTPIVFACLAAAIALLPQTAFAQTIDAMTHRPEFESVIKERRPEGDVAVFRLRP